MFKARRYAEAIASFQQMHVLQWWSHHYVASSYADLGQMDAAKRALAEVFRLKPDSPCATLTGQNGGVIPRASKTEGRFAQGGIARMIVPHELQ